MKGSLAVLVIAGALLLPSAALADIWEPVSGTPPTSLSEAAKGSIAFSLWDGDTLVHEQPERTLAGGFVTIR